jgi:hypothetical protein
MDTKQPVSELTVEELQSLIRHTVQEAVAEVMIEFAIASEIDAEIEREAEIVDYVRSAFHPLATSASLTDQSSVELDD